jgi:hypothetical protein
VVAVEIDYSVSKLVYHDVHGVFTINDSFANHCLAKKYQSRECEI